MSSTQFRPGFHPNLFDNRVVLITGGRSGIGYQTAELLLSLGAHIIIASRNEEKLKQAQAKLQENQPSDSSKVAAYPCDIRNTEQIKQLNTMVLDWVIPKIMTQIEQYLTYKQQVSGVYQPMEREINTSVSGTKTIELKSFF